MSHNIDTFKEYLEHCLAFARGVREVEKVEHKKAAEDFVLKVDQFVNAGGKSFTLGAPRLGSIKRPRSPDLVETMKTAKQILDAEDDDYPPPSPPPRVYIGYSNPINEALKHFGLPPNTGLADKQEERRSSELADFDVALADIKHQSLTLALPNEFEDEYNYGLTQIAALYEGGYGHVAADNLHFPFEGLKEDAVPSSPRRRVRLPRAIRNDHENDDDDDISASIEY